jgi:hypothetical protein
MPIVSPVVLQYDQPQQQQQQQSLACCRQSTL